MVGGRIVLEGDGIPLFSSIRYPLPCPVESLAVLLSCDCSDGCSGDRDGG